MINFCEALSLIKHNLINTQEELIKTHASLGCILANNIQAPLDLPPFTNSAVDGFAVGEHEITSDSQFLISNTIRAVAQEYSYLKANSCARIMTGAPLPKDATAVVMKEDAVYSPDKLSVSFTKKPVFGAHIRKQGEDVKINQLVAQRGQQVTPELLGLLLGLGVAEISVFKPPKLAIICTGDELVEAPQKLKYGEVYFFVGAMLKAQAQAIGLSEISIERVGDNKDAISASLHKAGQAELVLITGGMSKGEHDFVRPALAHVGVEEIFYQGLWRPGKPLYFGRTKKTVYFGLPGNPVACFVAFRIFVQSWLSALFTNKSLEARSYARLTHDTNKIANFTFFARAQCDAKNNITILPGQGSHEIYSLSTANALCYLPAGVGAFQRGEEVAYWSLL
jgi:molybdopterin molybdotransferase